MGLHAVRGAQETREGVFGHQSIDSLLCHVECVGTRRVHHTQHSLAGLSIQVYLRGRTDYLKKHQILLSFQQVLVNVGKFLQSFLIYHTLLSTDLLWGFRVDKLVVDAASLSLLLV